MREFLFNRSISDPASRVKFQDEILDLRADILRGLVVPLIALGWGGMAYGLVFTMEPPDWLTTLAFMAVLLIGIVCAALNTNTNSRLALWICAVGLWAAAFSALMLSTPDSAVVWLSAACVIATVLIGPALGWTLAGISIGGFTAQLISVSGGISLAQIAPTAVPLAALVLITHFVSRALIQALRWMSEGYDSAQLQAEQQRSIRTELSTAMKSLGQTSFALARANEQLEIMGKYAEDARRSKQEFAASVSHELRTPLNLIIGFSDLILNAPSTYNMRRLPPSMLADIHVIHQNAQHLLKLVNDILDMSQMDMAYMTITRMPTPIYSFVQSALQDFKPLVQSRGLSLDVEVEPGLPDIYIDKTRIRQVLLNLVNNAMRFTERGGITIRAYLDRGELQSATSGGDAVIISVSDTGTGIAPEEKQLIFEPFTKIDRSAKHLGGTGLGLTISKRFVELHGGRMWVESALGEGSSFFFTLPLNPPSFDAPTQGSLRQVRRQEVGALMVVERAPVLSRLLEHRLEGIRVCHASSMDDMLLKADTCEPEAILINQPSASSPAEPAQLERFKHIPVFRCFVPDIPVAPGRDPFAVENAPNTAGIRRYLIKPVTRERLYEIASEMLAYSCAERARSAAVAAPDNAMRAAHILVVEDDEDALHLMGRLLRSLPDENRQGYEAIIPVEMRSGEQALEYVGQLASQIAEGQNPPQNCIDGIMLDLKLGAVSGFDILDELDRHPVLCRIPTCIISGQEASGEFLITPYLNVARQPGLSARELTEVVATLMQLMLPGMRVTAREDSSPAPESLIEAG